MAAVCRRERLLASQVLDSRIATDLRVFSLAHRREQMFQALQVQARVVPEVVGQLQASVQATVEAMVAQVERQGQAQADRLLASQDAFCRHTQGVFQALAASVDRSLQQSLTEVARVAGRTIQPVTESALTALAREGTALHERFAATVTTRLDGLATQLADAARAQQQQACETLERSARAVHAEAAAQAQHTIGEMARLAQTASEAPRAAAEAMGQLRRQLSDSLARDNALLEERQRLMQTLQVLLGSIEHAATEQRSAVDALVASSSALLQQAGAQLAQRIDAESGRLEAAAAQVTGSAIEVSSLGEAFGFGVQQFSASNQALTAALQRIEGALTRSTERSDEQLAYYVAQAREVIDLSMLSQRQSVEDLQQLATRQASLASEAI
jgi:hypothetical protein